MTENATASSNTASKQFLLHQMYIKDLSFESPNSPDVFKQVDAEMETKLNIKNSHRELGDNRFEVILHLSVHAKRGDQTVFLIEIDQAGIFEMRGFHKEELGQIIGTHCPATLFPYVRETISSTATRGGFPPLVLQPINFEALYAQSIQHGKPQA
ncbi:MAG: protein-export chaperone SecB [Chromatiales bacterium]|jgi:preprotein translocase subunit SecB|nr:protein-export chaperone SecB [Chromatiales bacterium]